MSLSEKIYEDVDYKETFIYKKDVKEFIKKLKEELGAKSYETYLRVDAQGNINEGIIDKLAGEELI
jgi:hypothetical protein